ncbi:MAG: formate transporter FocA [Deltaproteobacteria bacterium]|nr:formate transporter FocA [Deltaproteobacteria bacterium]
MALKAEEVGVSKAALGWSSTLTLAVLAGAFVALGAVFSATVMAGSADAAWGLVRLAGGAAFSLGLILVVVAGAELFTGNNLIVMAWASRRVSTARLLRNWGLVYLGNFAGALATAFLVWLSGQYLFGSGAVGRVLLDAALLKCSHGFFQALALGALCNVLVCLAIWLCFSARTTTDKILSVIFPISAFVAAGFEHSVANMFFIPVALFIKAGAPAQFWAALGSGPQGYAALNWNGFLWANLLPVTLGNILGGSVMVGLVYWFIYIRRRG